jgi:branched-chain amino acid transport system permease protein
VAAVAVAATAGVLLGIPTLKLRGHYLAMATIGFGIIVQLVLVHWRSVTKGTDGIPGIPGPALGPISLAREEQRYYLLLAVFLVLALAAAYIRNTRLGRAFVAVRENELAAEALGVDTTRYKILAFALAAAYAGAAGSLYAHVSNFISPDSFSFEQSVQFLAMLVLGGSGSIAGATLGAVLLTFVPEWLKFVPFLPVGSYLAAYGAAIMLTMVYLPGGLIGLLDNRFKRRGVSPAGARPAQLPWSLGLLATPGDPFLETRGLVKAFGGVRAVAGLHLVVRPGEIHALVGPNGSGKTTTLNVINGIYGATAGSVLLMGRDITRLPPHERAALGMSRTFQNIRLFWDLTALENVVIGAHPRARFSLPGMMPNGRTAAQEQAAEAEARQLLAFVGLSGFEPVVARNLPYGAQRLLEIARALASRPRLLLLDEPAAGLNPAETEDLIVLLRRIRAAGITLLLIEHDMNLVMAISDVVTVLNFGEKICEGPPRVVERDERVIEAYLGREDLDLEMDQVEAAHA